MVLWPLSWLCAQGSIPDRGTPKGCVGIKLMLLHARQMLLPRLPPQPTIVPVALGYVVLIKAKWVSPSVTKAQMSQIKVL